MLSGHDYAVNTDLSVLGVTSPGEPKAGDLILICAVAGLEASCYTGRSSRCSGSVTRVARHPAAESYVRRCPQSFLLSRHQRAISAHAESRASATAGSEDFDRERLLVFAASAVAEVCPNPQVRDARP
jgi:hypothetical protein